MPASATQVKPEFSRFLSGAMVVIIVSLLVYLPAINGAFLWDDDVLITANTLLQKSDGLKKIWFSTEPTDYLPLTLTMFWAEWRLFGLNPMGYHVVNIFLHALGAILVWRVARQLGLAGSFFIGILFAVHPVCVPSVAWISEGKNTLSLVFYLLALWCYFRSGASDEKVARPGWYGAALLAFLLALLSKTSVVMTPVVLLLCAWWKQRNGSTPSTARYFSSQLLRLAPFFLLSLVFGLITVWFQKHRAIGEAATDGLLVRLAGGGWAAWFYLFKAMLPWNLTMIYPRWQINPSSPIAWGPWLAWGGLFFACYRFRATWGRGALFGLGYFFITLVPVLGIFDMSFFSFSRAADHLQYVSIIGISALAVAAIQRVGSKTATEQLKGKNAPPEMALGIKRPGWVIGLVLVLGVISAQRASNFASPEKLWRDNVKKNPKAWLAHNGLGNAFAAQRQFPEAISHFQTAISLRATYADAHNNLGSAYSDLGRLEEAIQEFKTALQHQPPHSHAENNLGFALARHGRLDEALPHYLNAIRINPEFPHVYNNLGLLYAQQKKFKEAEEQFRAALRLNPKYGEAQFNLASMFAESERLDDAVAEFKRALELVPDHIETFNALGVVLARKGDLEESARYLREAIRLDGKNAFAMGNLGLTLARQGKLDAAVQAYRDALGIDANDPGTFYNLANALVDQGRLEEAAENFQQASKLEPNPRFHLGWGIALARLGRSEDAARQFREALRLNPNLVEAQKQLDLLSPVTVLPR